MIQQSAIADNCTYGVATQISYNSYPSVMSILHIEQCINMILKIADQI